MRTLITGVAGFIGSHVFRLLKEERELVGFDSLDERVHGTKTPDHWVPGVMRKYYCSAIPPEQLGGVDTVIHLAAQVSVADSASDPLRYITQNTEGTARMLLKLPRSVKRLVVASSMSVYGEGGVLVTEDAPVCPASVYGLTKYDQERLCLMWGEQYGVPVAALRFFNVYGPGQSLNNSYTGVLANFAKALLGGRSPKVFEDGLQTRDFIHVSDVARAVALAADSTAHGVFNVCTGQDTTILGAAQALARGLGRDLPPDVTGEKRVGDIRHCTGSPVKAERELGFVAKIPFSAGIQNYAKALR